MKIFAFCLLLALILAGCNTRPPEPIASPPETSQWQEIQGENVALSIPPGYVGGNPNTDLDRLSAQLEAIAPDSAPRLQAVRQNPEATALLAFDTRSLAPNSTTNLNLTVEEREADRSLEAYVANAASQLARTHEIIEQTPQTIGSHAAIRLLARSQTSEGTAVTQLFYAIATDTEFLTLTYTTPSDEFARREPEFERSFRSLQVRPAADSQP